MKAQELAQLANGHTSLFGSKSVVLRAPGLQQDRESLGYVDGCPRIMQGVFD